MQSWGAEWPVVHCSKPSPTGEGVIDQEAFSAIEIDELFETVDHAATTAGQAVIYRSLCQPLDSVAAIKQKQEALLELENNAELSKRIENIVAHAAADEASLYKLLYGNFLGSFSNAIDETEIEGFGYTQYIKGTRFLLHLVANISQSEAPKSQYLAAIFDKINTFSETRSFSLMQGPVYISERGIQSKEERKNSFVPAIIFKPQLFKPLLIISVAVLIGMLIHFFPTDMFSFSAASIPVISIFFIPLLLVYIPIVGGFDRDNCIIPLRTGYRNCRDVAAILDALGQLDELLAFIKLSKAYGSRMVLPEIITNKHHKITLKNAKNPILGYQNDSYVGNDFALENEKLVFITGPNSGGKTAFCKTITQMQILAQTGCFVPADFARMSVADKIFYQAPEISYLDDGEGRFGTELKRTKAIFMATTAKSLVVLDELSEGTTFEEKLETSINVLNGFYKKGNCTILITHNHQLVDYFINHKMGIAKQVEFADDEPTYKLITGISRVSHADRVARKIGFSKDDIDSMLARDP